MKDAPGIARTIYAAGMGSCIKAELPSFKGPFKATRQRRTLGDNRTNPIFLARPLAHSAGLESRYRRISQNVGMAPKCRLWRMSTLTEYSRH